MAFKQPLYFQIGSVGLSMSYSAGTFTIADYQGKALSGANLSYVTLQSQTSGFSNTFPLSSNYTFTDAAGTNDIGANLFGITSGVAWGLDCPFYLYAVSNSANNDVAIGFGRIPHLTQSPAATKLAVAGTTIATTQGSLFLMKKGGVTPTVANFASQPCVCIGTFRMRATSTPAWTVQGLDFSKDGIGTFNESTTFFFPQGQHGASASTWLLANGGTAPTFSSSATTGYGYSPKRNGMCKCSPFMNGDGGTAGLGAVATQLALPLALDSSGSGSSYGCFTIISGAVAQAATGVINSGAIIISNFLNVTNTNLALTNAAFLAGARNIEGAFEYQMDKL